MAFGMTMSFHGFYTTMPTQAIFNGLLDCVFYGRILSNVFFGSPCASPITVALNQTLAKSLDSERAMMVWQRKVTHLKTILAW